MGSLGGEEGTEEGIRGGDQGVLDALGCSSFLSVIFVIVVRDEESTFVCQVSSGKHISSCVTRKAHFTAVK
jgi:hypothetical protein